MVYGAGPVIAVLVRHVRSIGHQMALDGVGTLASAIAYAALLSIFPLLILVIALLSIFVAPYAAQDAVVRALAPYLPEGATEMVELTLRAVVVARESASLLALAALLWGASVVASALRTALNRVLRVGRPRPFVRQKLVEFALVLVGGLFMSLSVITSTALTVLAVVRPLAEVGALLRRSGLAEVAAVVGPWLLSAAAFFIVYRFLPNVRLHRRSLLAGTAVAVVLFELIKAGFFWYLRTLAGYSLVYGPLTGVVVLLIWVYLGAMILLIGAEVMAELERTRSAHA